MVKKPEIFEAAETGEKLKQIGTDELHFVKIVPKQLPKGVSEESLAEQAHSQSILFLAIIIVIMNIAFWLNGETVYFWTFLQML